MYIIGTSKVKGKNVYKCSDGFRTVELHLSDVLPLIHNGSIENAVIQKVYGRETVKVLPYKPADAHATCQQAVKKYDENPLINYVRGAAAIGIKVLDLGPIQVDTSTFNLRFNPNYKGNGNMNMNGNASQVPYLFAGLTEKTASTTGATVPIVTETAVKAEKLEKSGKLEKLGGVRQETPVNEKEHKANVPNLPDSMTKIIRTSYAKGKKLMEQNEIWINYLSASNSAVVTGIDKSGKIKSQNVLSLCHNDNLDEFNYIADMAVHIPVRLSIDLPAICLERILTCPRASANKDMPLQITTNVFDTSGCRTHCKGYNAVQFMVDEPVDLSYFENITDTNTAVPHIQTNNFREYLRYLNSMMNPILDARGYHKYGLTTHLMNYKMALTAQANKVKKVNLVLGPHQLGLGMLTVAAVWLYEEDLHIGSLIDKLIKNTNEQLKIMESAGIDYSNMHTYEAIKAYRDYFSTLNLITR